MAISRTTILQALSPRHRKLLLQTMAENRQAGAVQPAAQYDLPILLRAVHERESWLAALRPNDVPQAQFIRDYRDPAVDRISAPFVTDWTNGFLDAVKEFSETWKNYVDGVNAYRAFRATLPTPLRRLSNHPNFHPLGFVLGCRQEVMGLDAEMLGRYEAHVMARRLLQVFFARASAEMVRPLQKRPVTWNLPRNRRLPAIEETSRRQNQRTKLMPQQDPYAEGWRVDPATLLVLYLDRIGQQMDLPSWAATRPIYEQQVLLLPGLPEIDRLIAKAEHNYGTLPNALLEWAERSAAFKDHPEIGPETAAEYELLQLAANPTLCLMNTLRGARYVDPKMNWLKLGPLVPDAFAQGILPENFWQLWEKADQKASATAKERRQLAQIRAREKALRKQAERRRELAEKEARLENLRARIDAETKAADPPGFMAKLEKRRRKKALQVKASALQAEIRLEKQKVREDLRQIWREKRIKAEQQQRAARDKEKAARIQKRFEEYTEAPPNKLPKKEKSSKAAPSKSPSPSTQPTGRKQREFHTAAEKVRLRQRREAYVIRKLVTNFRRGQTNKPEP